MCKYCAYTGGCIGLLMATVLFIKTNARKFWLHLQKRRTSHAESENVS